MAIIICLYILMFCMLKKHLNKLNKTTKILIIGGLIFELLLLLIYRIDLFNLGRAVYYSDAETYWQHTLELINKGHTSGYNSLYYYMCYFIQKTSPFIWVGWNNIFNITCINFSIVIIIINLLKNDEKNIKRVNSLLFFTMYNPFIIYGLMRNLKDSLFMFMTFIVGYLLLELISNKNKIKKLIIIFMLLVMTYLFVMIRPWAFIIPIIALICALMHKLFRKNKKINITKVLISLLIIIILMVAICYMVPSIYINIKLWTPIVLKSFTDRSILMNFLGIFRFIFAPGPLRSFMGHEYFEHYLITGNIMSGIGQLMWWSSILIMLVTILKNKFKFKYLENNLFTVYLAIVTIIYTFIYVFQYGGIGEIRLKSVLYMFIYSIFFGIYSVLPYQENKKMYNSFLIIMLIIFILITWVGM